jgi:hypothetical protein
VNTITDHANKLSALDAGTRRAWHAYRERLHELTADAYEQAEHEAWAELQRELRRLEHRRRTPHQTAG